MVDRAAMERAHEIFDPIAADHLARPDVDIGPMFGTEGLRVRGKVYAFVEHQGGLIAKVPQSRADELCADGTALRMVMREREMREWVTVTPSAGADTWRSLIDEAHDFVDRLTPR
jgi:hypothetical protein